MARSVFISVANTDLEPAARRVELWSGDRLLEVRDVMLEPQARADVYGKPKPIVKNARGRLVSGRPLKPEDLVGSRSRYIVEGVAPK